MIFITSVPIHPSIIKYYVSLLDPEIRDTIDERLLLMSCFDTSHVPLSSKVLARPRMQRKIMLVGNSGGRMLERHNIGGFQGVCQKSECFSFVDDLPHSNTTGV